MSRSSALLALLVALCAVLLTACSEEQERAGIAQTLERAAQSTQRLGVRMTTNGTMTVDGISTTLRSRATVAPGGRRARITTQFGRLTFEQYLDGRSMLMGVDALPAAGGWPPGTRYLRFDIGALAGAAGMDSALRDLQSLDPAKAARLLADVADVRSVGRGSVRGVPVTRYGADVDVARFIDAFTGGTATSDGAAGLLRGSKMTIDIAIDGDDRIRGFGMRGELGAMRMDFRGEVTQYSRTLAVAIPTQGVYDVTDTLAGALGP